MAGQPSRTPRLTVRCPSSITTTNNAGNFIIENSALCSQASCLPYRVRLTLDGRTREMLTPQTDGDCMSCHTAVGRDGAPGRIVAP